MANVKEEIVTKVKKINSLLLNLFTLKGEKKTKDLTPKEVTLVQNLKKLIDEHNMSGEKYLIQPPTIYWSAEKVLAESEKLKVNYKLK